MNKDIGKIYQEAFKDFEQEPPKDLFNSISSSWKHQTNLRFYKKWGIVSGIAVAVISVIILLTAKTEELLPALAETNIEQVSEAHDVTSETIETIVKQDVLKPEKPVILLPENEMLIELCSSQNPEVIEIKEVKVEPQIIKSSDSFTEVSKRINEVKDVDEVKDNFTVGVDSTVITKQEVFSSSEIMQEAPEKSAIFIPSAFSPDGDGINETFKIETEQDFATFEWSVYSKTGKMLFHTKSVHGYWDGTFKGQPMPRDMYIYVVLYTDKQGQKQQLKGSFWLLK